MEVSSACNQAMASHHGPLEEVLAGCPNVNHHQQPEKKPRPQPEQALRCPRCDSTNTKFCYYNNYSLSQPRYFCKGCRRYWTQGGSLRNVPVGGGCRKNKRSSSSFSSSSSNSYSKKAHDQYLLSTLPPPPSSPPLSYDPGDLSLAFTTLPIQGLVLDDHASFPLANPNPSFLDILRSGIGNTDYFGFGGNDSLVLPIDGASSTSSGTAAAMASEGECKVMDEEENKVGMCLPWQQFGGDLSMGLDGRRNYWNGLASASSSSSWHGLIDSSLI